MSMSQITLVSQSQTASPRRATSPRHPILQSHHITRMSKQLSSKLQQLDMAQTAFKRHQQQSFYRVFQQVMDKMSNQLGKAQQKYQNIDKQLQTNQKVIRINKELFFFRSECMHLFRENQVLKEEIKKVRMENQMLVEEQGQMKKLLRKQKVENLRVRERSREWLMTAEEEGSHKGSRRIMQNQLVMTPASNRGRVTTHNRVYADWVNNGRSTSLRTSTNPSTSTPLQEALGKLQKQAEKGDNDPAILTKIAEYESIIKKIKKRIPSDNKRAVTNITEMEKPSRLLKHTHRARMSRKATPIIIADDQPPSYG